AGPGVVERSAVAIEAVALPADGFELRSRSVPTRPTTAAAAATPARASTSLRGERWRWTRGETVEVPTRERLACSAARLALIRSTRYAGIGSGSGRDESSARTPVGSSSGDSPGGLRGVITVTSPHSQHRYGGLGAGDAAA